MASLEAVDVATSVVDAKARMADRDPPSRLSGKEDDAFGSYRPVLGSEMADRDPPYVA